MRKATEEWLKAARDDLNTIAEIVENAGLTNVVAFHAQQCVERCLKAVMEENEQEVPNTHDLVRLERKVEARLPASLETVYEVRD